MTDSLDGLESYVEAVRNELVGCVERYYLQEAAESAVLALAEPLRRAERVEQVEQRDDEIYAITLKQSKRIEELEAALRHLKSARIPGCPQCDHANALLDTEAKP